MTYSIRHCNCVMRLKVYSSFLVSLNIIYSGEKGTLAFVVLFLIWKSNFAFSHVVWNQNFETVSLLKAGIKIMSAHAFLHFLGTLDSE